MNRHAYFRRMFAYDHWANRECLSVSNLPANALRLMAHILFAEKLWLERLCKQPQSMPVWPDSPIQDCVRLCDEMSLAWEKHLDGLAPGGTDQTIDYRNSKGELWSSRVGDVLTHVLFHSAYHRGQVALEVRSAGAQPAYTDFIHGVRNGLVP
jgi:uncharacterized damage-inducible protein DinB